MFVDSHAHLEGPRYNDDRAQTLARAFECGIEGMLAIGNGNSPAEADCGIKLADEFDGRESLPRMWASIGVHPHEAKLASDEDWPRFEQWAKHPKVIAWGEIGLDYWYDHSPRDVQKSIFVRQMELARNAKLPIIIHTRSSQNGTDAWDDTLDLVRRYWSWTGLGGIMHCFSGTEAHARASLNMGFMLSFAGNITFPKAGDIRAVASSAPLDRVLIETDSPYLAPVPHRGKRNEPAFVREVARQIAELRGATVEEIGSQTTRNFYRFFRIESAKNPGGCANAPSPR
jgi:TatD DNase family protein